MINTDEGLRSSHVGIEHRKIDELFGRNTLLQFLRYL